jgi:hypothetical protein
MIEAKMRAAVQMAAQMLADNGLDDWQITIKDVTSYLARIYYKPKLIIYSLNFITIATKEQFGGITYHEISHAIAGKYHDQAFKDKYYELSGNRDFSGSHSNLQIKRFIAHCRNCDTRNSINDYSPRWCRYCFKNSGRIIKLNIVPNPLQVVVWD